MLGKRSAVLLPIAVSLIFCLPVCFGSLRSSSPIGVSSLWHPIPENQIYRDIQVTVKDTRVEVRLVARASENTWMTWLERTKEKISKYKEARKSSPKSGSNKKEPEGEDFQAGKRSVSSAGRVAGEEPNAGLGLKHQLKVPKVLPKTVPETVKWLQKKENLEFISLIVRLQTSLELNGKRLKLTKSKVQHSGRHHWAIEMNWVFSLSKTAQKQPLSLPRLSHLPKELPVKEFPAAKDESADKTGPAGRQEDAQKLIAREKPSFEPNLLLKVPGFSDFSGLIRRGIRVRGNSELERTDHEVLVVRCPFEFRVGSQKPDAVWAKVFVGQVE